MSVYEIMKAREELKEKERELHEKFEDADAAMRTAYEIYRKAEASVDNFSDEEVEELCDIYEAHCEVVDKLEEQMEILEHAIEVFNDMETVVDELSRYKLWEG